DVLGVLPERVVDLAAECRRRGVPHVVVGSRRDLLHLVVERPGMALAEARDRRLHAPTLCEQLDPKTLRVDAHQRLSFLIRAVAEADASRPSATAGASPASSTILSRALWPETSVSESRGTPSVSASRRRTASFARPPSGAAVTRSFQPSPYRPTIAARPAPGLTRKRRRVMRAVY